MEAPLRRPLRGRRHGRRYRNPRPGRSAPGGWSVKVQPRPVVRVRPARLRPRTDGHFRIGFQPRRAVRCQGQLGPGRPDPDSRCGRRVSELTSCFSLRAHEHAGHSVAGSEEADEVGTGISMTAPPLTTPGRAQLNWNQRTRPRPRQSERKDPHAPLREACRELGLELRRRYARRRYVPAVIDRGVAHLRVRSPSQR